MPNNEENKRWRFYNKARFQLKYKGAAPNMSVSLRGGCENTATNISDKYAIIGGGQYFNGSTVYYYVTNAYDKDLIRHNPANMHSAVDAYLAVPARNHALFIGGVTTSAHLANVTAYDETLAKSSLTNMPVGSYSMAGIGFNGYAVATGGQDRSTSNSRAIAYAWDETLTMTTLPSLSTARHLHAASKVDNKYVLMAGGTRSWNKGGNSQNLATVEAYDKDFVKVSVGSMPEARSDFSSLYLDGYALFCGNVASRLYSDVYDSNLVRTRVPLSYTPQRSAGLSLRGKYGILGYAYTSSGGTATIQIYDTDLTLTTQDNVLSKKRIASGTASFGNYGFFMSGWIAGASASRDATNNVDVFELV